MGVLTHFISYEISLTKKYDFRFFVLLCFLLQSFLLVAAPFRKWTSNRVYLCLIWLAYLVSDWSSYFALGLIPVNETSTSEEQKFPAPSTQNAGGLNNDILMLWAQFLLVHMGGVDSITALSSSDNDLWSSFAIQLVFIVIGIIIKAFYRFFGESNMKGLVMVMFVAGLSRLLERIVCLFQTRFSSLKESILEQRQKTKSSQNLVDVEEEFVEERINTHGLSDAKMLRHAYLMFTSFKALFVDLHVEDDDRRKSREYFMRRNPREAFKIVEMELNFSYDLFYTKGPLIRHGIERFLHPIYMICEVTALVIWIRVEKEHLYKYDRLGTYALLVGTVARDLVSLWMLTFSDLTFATVAKSGIGSMLVKPCVSQGLFRRWSESVSQLNLIEIAIFPKKEFSSFWGRKSAHEAEGFDIVLNKLRKVSKESLTNELRDFIFLELQDRSTTHSEAVDNLVSTSRGQWALRNYGELICLSNTWIVEKTFDQSILIWHIAATLCYHTKEDEEDESSESQFSKLSKLLSDYMLYLLIRRPEMMLQVAAMGDMRYEATCKNVETFVSSFSIQNRGDDDEIMESVCKRLLSRIRSSSDEGEEYSVLIDACGLAKELKELKERRGIKMWEVIAKVWAEMLIYAAVRCSPSAHAAELANSGELLTIVWMLAHHFGLPK